MVRNTQTLPSLDITLPTFCRYSFGKVTLTPRDDWHERPLLAAHVLLGHALTDLAIVRSLNKHRQGTPPLCQGCKDSSFTAPVPEELCLVTGRD